jgi:hypothetical protein
MSPNVGRVSSGKREGCSLAALVGDILLISVK